MSDTNKNNSDTNKNHIAEIKHNSYVKNKNKNLHDTTINKFKKNISDETLNKFKEYNINKNDISIVLYFLSKMKKNKNLNIEQKKILRIFFNDLNC